MTQNYKLKICSGIKAIFNLLESVEDWKSNSPYQNVKFLRSLLKQNLVYSIIRLTRPIFVECYVDDRLTAIIPLNKKIFRNIYTFYGDRAGVAYADILCKDEVDVKVMADLFLQLKDKFKDGEFIFNRVKSDANCFKALQLTAIQNNEEQCVKIKLPNTFDDYFKKLTKNTQQNIRTAKNRVIRESINWEIICLSCNEITPSIRDEIIEIYLKRKKEIFKTKINLFEYLFHKYQDVSFSFIENSNTDMVYLFYIEEKLAAFMSCMNSEESILVPKLAINSYFKFYSPGLLMLMHVIEECITNKKILEIDLMQGNENYKLQIGGVMHNCYSFTMK